MRETSRTRSPIARFLSFVALFLLQFLPGVCGDLSSLKNTTRAESNAKSSSNTGTKVVIMFLAVVAVGLFSFFLFRLWQKKKREEQYARLLKLFEEDDDLEVELGLRD